MWYRFTAFNQQTHYGWTRDVDIAKAACDWLNRGKEIGLYDFEEIDESEIPIDILEVGSVLTDDDTTEDEYRSLIEDGGVL